MAKPETPRTTGIHVRAWALGALVLVLAAVAAAVFVDRWLDRRAFRGRTTPSFDEPLDGGLVGLASLTRVADDAGVSSADASLDATVPTDAGIDAALAPLDGPAPGRAWASRTRNYLLVGVDRRPWGRGGGLADTIVLVALDTRSGHVGLVSIPRDYYIEFRPGAFGRINTAFAYARENGMSRAAYLAQVVSTLLEVPIRDTFIVDMTVLERVVDAVQGVEVDVPCAIRDNFVDPRTDTGRRLLDVPAGRVHMDGPTAAMYARSRHGRSDWDRARRQQAVILGLRRRVTSLDVLPLVPQLLDELDAHIETELSRREILELARYGLRISADNMHGMVLSSTASQHYRTPEGSSVLIPDVVAIRAQIVDLFDAPAPGVEARPSRCADVDAALTGRVARSAPDAGPGARSADAGVTAP